LCFVVIAVGTIRLARFNTKPLSVPGYWIGYPRPATAIFIACLLNSKIFLSTLLYIPVAIIILIVGFLNLTYLPYKSNKAKLTNFQIFIVFLAPTSSMLLHPFGLMWDVGLFWMIVYTFTPWLSVRKHERAEIGQIIDTWKQSP
jgi:phosphatidylserine synthase